jgi:hypothetical protein
MYIRPRGIPIIFISLAPLHSGDTTCKQPTHTKPPQEVGYYAPQAARTCRKSRDSLFLVPPTRTIELQSTTPSYPKAPRGYPWVCGRTLNTDTRLRNYKCNQALIVGFGDNEHTILGIICLLSNVTEKASKREKTYGKGGTSRVYKICCTFHLLY